MLILSSYIVIFTVRITHQGGGSGILWYTVELSELPSSRSSRREREASKKTIPILSCKRNCCFFSWPMLIYSNSGADQGHAEILSTSRFNRLIYNFILSFRSFFKKQWKSVFSFVSCIRSFRYFSTISRRTRRVFRLSSRLDLLPIGATL